MRATIKGHEANGAISLEFIFIRKYCTHPRKKGGKEKEPEPCREIANTRTTPWHFDTRRVFFSSFSRGRCWNGHLKARVLFSGCCVVEYIKVHEVTVAVPVPCSPALAVWKTINEANFATLFHKRTSPHALVMLREINYTIIRRGNMIWFGKANCDSPNSSKLAQLTTLDGRIRLN